MIARRLPPTLIPVLMGAALLAALAFLFVKTQSAGYKQDAQALALLRELRDMDTGWDADGLRLANDFATRPAVVPDRNTIVARIFQELEFAHRGASETANVPALRAAVTEKQTAFRALRAAHVQSYEAFTFARDALNGLAAQASASRARNPRGAEAAAALANNVEQLRSVLRAPDIEFQQEIARAAEPRIATLVPAAGGDPQAIEAARKADEASRAFLAARAAEGDAWRKFAFLTVGARVDQAARALSQSIERSLAESDRWRVYLFAYATALLIGVGYLGARVITTQSKLREANALLEARVAERTRDLEQALRRLQESEAQLVQSEKMSSLGQLVAGVAHEINTPLAYLKNSMSVVRERLPAIQKAMGDNDALLDLDDLTRDGMHGIDEIAELVSNLKNFSRLDRSKVASFNVNEGVRATLLIARPALRKVDVEQRLGEIPSITCSPSQVNQVLLNLVTNAAQAIEKPRGQLRLTTRREGADYIAIEVNDNGRGIAPDTMARIFDPFFTTKEVGKGTGLGLTIAYKIVAQHGGRIDVRSEEGVGSTFTVVLPVTPPADGTRQDEEVAA